MTEWQNDRMTEWQNDRMTAVLRRVKVFRSQYITERLYDDIYIRFKWMLYWLVLNWFISFRKNKVSSFLKFEAAHFIELDSSSNLSPHPPVILHEGLARSCRIHCFNKRKTNSSLWRSCPSVWIKGGGKWSYRHSPTVSDDPQLPEREG